MAVTVMRDTIVCPGCGSQRVVTHRQRRRAHARDGGILCSICRGFGVTRAYDEADLRFWLRRYGTPCPPGTPVRQFLAAGGAPQELIDLAQQVFPE